MFPFSNLHAGKFGFIVPKTDDLKQSSGMVPRTPLQTLPHPGCHPRQQGRVVSTPPKRYACKRKNRKHKVFCVSRTVVHAETQGFLAVCFANIVRLVTKNMATTPNFQHTEVHSKGKRQFQNCPARDVVCSD